MRQGNPFVCVVLGAVGGFALVVGFHDALNAEDFESRTLGGALFGMGLMLVLASVFALLADTGWSRRFAVAASIVSLSLGASFLFAHIKSHDPNPLLIVWVLAIICSLVSAFGSFRKSDWSGLSVSEKVGGFLSIVPVAVLLSAVQFYYNSIYLPGRQAPQVSVTTELSQARRIGDTEILNVTITAKNPSDSRVRVLGSTYAVTGISAKTSTRGLEGRKLWKELARPAIGEDTLGSPTVGRRFAAEERLTPVEGARITSADFIFEPGEEYSTRTLAYLPAKRFEAVRLTAEFVVAKSRVTLTPDTKTRYPYGRKPVQLEGPEGIRAVVSRRDVVETSWVRELTRGDRVLFVSYIVDQRERPDRPLLPLLGLSSPRKPDQRQRPDRAVFPVLGLFFDRKGRKPPKDPFDDDYGERLNEFYGPASASSSYELALTEADASKGRRR